MRVGRKQKSNRLASPHSCSRLLPSVCSISLLPLTIDSRFRTPKPSTWNEFHDLLKIRLIADVLVSPGPNDPIPLHEENSWKKPGITDRPPDSRPFPSSLHSSNPDSGTEYLTQTGWTYIKVGKDSALRIRDRTGLRPKLAEELAAILQRSGISKKNLWVRRICLNTSAQLFHGFLAKDSTKVAQEDQQNDTFFPLIAQCTAFQILPLDDTGQDLLWDPLFKHNDLLQK